MWSKKFIVLLFVILILGVFLRVRNLASVPLPGQSQDEYSNTWVGLSLIEIGMPVGMTGVSGNLNRERIYINPDHIFQMSASGDPLTISYPWFDHPPIVGLITGGYSYLRGARVFEDVSARVIRQPTILFSAITILMIGILGYEWFGMGVGLMGALFLLCLTFGNGDKQNGTGRKLFCTNRFDSFVLLLEICKLTKEQILVCGRWVANDLYFDETIGNCVCIGKHSISSKVL